MKWLVFHLPDSHARLGALPLSQLNAAKVVFRMSHMQTDANGTEHWIVFGEK